jgi:hypothetical protein
MIISDEEDPSLVGKHITDQAVGPGLPAIFGRIAL